MKTEVSGRRSSAARPGSPRNGPARCSRSPGFSTFRDERRAFLLDAGNLALLYSQLLIWRGYYWPMGGLFYVPILSVWGLNPLHAFSHRVPEGQEPGLPVPSEAGAADVRSGDFRRSGGSVGGRFGGRATVPASGAAGSRRRPDRRGPFYWGRENRLRQQSLVKPSTPCRGPSSASVARKRPTGMNSRPSRSKNFLPTRHKLHQFQRARGEKPRAFRFLS